MNFIDYQNKKVKNYWEKQKPEWFVCKILLQLYVDKTQDTPGARLNECEAPGKVVTARLP